ncbi:MAG: glycosyltransferase [Candidatus Omnitrophica bacterium]|nr:glycosyltransferase [Candidatus Omnitrophota bacterium]
MIYFILPIYNEKNNLAALIANIRGMMSGRQYRIVAVNDGSTDGSLEMLEALRREDLMITGSVINMNVGAVFSAGLAAALQGAANDDIIVIMESDQTSEQSLVLPMAEKIVRGEADIVVASRYLPGGKYINFPFFRLIFSHGANRLMRVFFPIRDIRDYTIFFRVYRARVLKEASFYFGSFGLIQSKGFVANAELLIKLSLFTTRIVEVPFVYNYGKKKGASKINVLRTINEYFVLITYLKRIMKKHAALKAPGSAEGMA